MQAIGRAPDTSAWMEKERNIELGKRVGGQERGENSYWVTAGVLDGCNPNVHHHFITELMTFESG